MSDPIYNWFLLDDKIIEKKVHRIGIYYMIMYDICKKDQNRLYGVLWNCGLNEQANYISSLLLTGIEPQVYRSKLFVSYICRLSHRHNTMLAFTGLRYGLGK